MPGHTPGHSSVLVRLKEMGPVLLTGDLVHFRESYESNGVPSFNFDRAATVASIERMKRLGLKNLRLHDQRQAAASTTTMAGVSQRAVIAMLGHRDPRMTAWCPAPLVRASA